MPAAVQDMRPIEHTQRVSQRADMLLAELNP